MSLLPSSRNTTYTGGTPVKSVDLNDLQDCLIGAKHPLITRRLSAMSGASFSATQTAGGGNFSPTTSGAWVATAQFQTLCIPLPVYVNERIVNIRGFVSCGVTDVLNMEARRTVYTVGGAGSSVQLGSAPASAGHSGLIERLSITGINEVPGSFTSNYFVLFDAAQFANAPTVYGIELDVDAL